MLSQGEHRFAIARLGMTRLPLNRLNRHLPVLMRASVESTPETKKPSNKRGLWLRRLGLIPLHRDSNSKINVLTWADIVKKTKSHKNRLVSPMPETLVRAMLCIPCRISERHAPHKQLVPLIRNELLGCFQCGRRPKQLPFR